MGSAQNGIGKMSELLVSDSESSCDSKSEDDEGDVPSDEARKMAETLGVAGGVGLALNVETIVPAIESLFNVEFLAADVYYISDVPSELHWNDVWVMASVSLGLSLLATLYPAWRAARTQPAEALRYE